MVKSSRLSLRVSRPMLYVAWEVVVSGAELRPTVLASGKDCLDE